MERIKEFFGFGDEYQEEDGYYEPDNRAERTEEAPQERATRTTTKREPLSLHGGSSNTQMKITVHEPLTYDESPNIVHDLRERKAVVLNFEQLDPDVKRNIFDFVNGALYALDGKIQRVNNDIFILAPSNVAIEGLKEELQEKGVFPW